MSWWLRKPSQVNYAEDSEEEDLETGLVFDSPLTSPGRPHQSASVSPRVLLQPDPPLTEEVLEEVTNKLSELNNQIDPLEIGEEVEESGVVAEQPQVENCQEQPSGSEDEDNNMAVNFDMEDKEDGEKAADQARSIKIEFDLHIFCTWFSFEFSIEF